MQYLTDFQTQYFDHQRQMAWVNETGWQFDPPMTRTRFRVKVARAFVALATRFAPSARRASVALHRAADQASPPL